MSDPSIETEIVEVADETPSMEPQSEVKETRKKQRKPLTEEQKAQRREALKKARDVKKAKLRLKEQAYFRHMEETGKEDDYSPPKSRYQSDGIRKVGRPRQPVVEDYVDEDADDDYEMRKMYEELLMEKYGRNGRNEFQEYDEGNEEPEYQEAKKPTKGRPKQPKPVQPKKPTKRELDLALIDKKLDVLLRDAVKNKKKPREKVSVVNVPLPQLHVPQQQQPVILQRKVKEPEKKPKAEETSFSFFS